MTNYYGGSFRANYGVTNQRQPLGTVWGSGRFRGIPASRRPGCIYVDPAVISGLQQGLQGFWGCLTPIIDRLQWVVRQPQPPIYVNRVAPRVTQWWNPQEFNWICGAFTRSRTTCEWWDRDLYRRRQLIGDCLSVRRPICFAQPRQTYTFPGTRIVCSLPVYRQPAVLSRCSGYIRSGRVFTGRTSPWQPRVVQRNPSDWITIRDDFGRGGDQIIINDTFQPAGSDNVVIRDTFQPPASSDNVVIRDTFQPGGYTGEPLVNYTDAEAARRGLIPPGRGFA